MQNPYGWIGRNEYAGFFVIAQPIHKEVVCWVPAEQLLGKFFIDGDDKDRTIGQLNHLLCYTAHEE
jgi:hypothetical protein